MCGELDLLCAIDINIQFQVQARNTISRSVSVFLGMNDSVAQAAVSVVLQHLG